MQDNKTYSPYHGALIVIIALIAVPVGLRLLFWVALDYYKTNFPALNDLTANFLGGFLGLLFHLSCMIGGLMRGSFRVVVYRVKEFFANLPCSLGFALRCYWEDLQTDGALFIIYMLIIGGNLYFTVDALLTILPQL